MQGAVTVINVNQHEVRVRPCFHAYNFPQLVVITVSTEQMTRACKATQIIRIEVFKDLEDDFPRDFIERTPKIFFVGIPGRAWDILCSSIPIRFSIELYYCVDVTFTACSFDETEFASCVRETFFVAASLLVVCDVGLR